MIVSAKAKCIFVHIQKTGGASIESLLLRHDPAATTAHEGRRHLTARDMRALVPVAVWSESYKFAFVRNPWDRLVSWYHMCMQVPTPNPFSVYIRQHAPTFGDFVTKSTTGVAARTTRNQLDYVTDDNGEVIVDFIGRYEALQADLGTVGERLGIAVELPHLNRSSHRDYREYYTDETRDIVAERFADDLRQFGYKF
jgi:chondroitin 4-sulfotransferase 11